MGKERLDVLLAEKGLTESRGQAQRLILAGKVRVDGTVICKVGIRVKTDADLAVQASQRFVSRGGEKLEEAFRSWPLDVTGCVCLDIGASTGGFTDCLLQHGASRVIAVDVGRGQLHWKLRQDPRVIVMEKVNARYLEPDDLSDVPSFAVVDVSFISLTKILPAAVSVLTPDAEMVTLIKPQFEAGRKDVGRGGVVRRDEIREAVVDKIRTFGCNQLGLTCEAVTTSPLKGPAGNTEFLAWWKKHESVDE